MRSCRRCRRVCHDICVPPPSMHSAGILCRLRALVAFAVLAEPLPNRHESPLGVHAQLVERSCPQVHHPRHHCSVTQSQKESHSAAADCWCGQSVQTLLANPSICPMNKLQLVILYALRYQKTAASNIAVLVNLLLEQGVSSKEARVCPPGMD